MVEINKNKQGTEGQIQQRTHEGTNKEEEDIDTQEYELVIEEHNDGEIQAEEETRGHMVQAEEGEQNQQEMATQDYKDVQEHGNKH
eukprot:9136226-Heterocapsa_arctica.AAC.1